MRSSRVLALIVAVLLFPSVVWAQQTIYGCVKNGNGQIRIVSAGEACLPSEHAVQWPLGGATAAAPPPAPPAPLRVVDQQGVELGLFAGLNYAVRHIGAGWYAVPLTLPPIGLQVSDPPMTFYQQQNCGGEAYLPVDMNNVLRTGVVTQGTSGQLLFWYPSLPDVDRTMIQSAGYFSGSTWTCIPSFTPGPWMPVFGKAASLDVSSFVAPFKIVQ